MLILVWFFKRKIGCKCLFFLIIIKKKKHHLQLFQSDKLQEQQDLIAELQCHLSTPGLLGLGLNLSSRPHTAPMGSMQHGPNGGFYRQVRSHLVCYNIIIYTFIFFTCLIIIFLYVCPGNIDESQNERRIFNI